MSDTTVPGIVSDKNITRGDVVFELAQNKLYRFIQHANKRRNTGPRGRHLSLAIGNACTHIKYFIDN